MDTHPQIREIHIDADEAGADFLQAVSALGFFQDNFTHCGNGMKPIPCHWTWQIIGPKYEVSRRQQEVYARLVEIAKSDTTFVGYIEEEVVDFRSEHQIQIPWHEYDASVSFPLARPLELTVPLSSEHKLADVHIKVPLASLHPLLEGRMAEYHTCFVDTPKGNRIYTLQFLEKEDALAAHEALTLHFMAAGGVVEITYEVCPEFFRKPLDLVVPFCVKKGSLAYLSS